jgi:hypothetical protein
MAGREAMFLQRLGAITRQSRLISDVAFHFNGQRPHFFDLEIIAFIINSSFMARADKMF